MWPWRLGADSERPALASSDGDLDSPGAAAAAPGVKIAGDSELAPAGDLLVTLFIHPGSQPLNFPSSIPKFESS